jgi:hypothetical protein
VKGYLAAIKTVVDLSHFARVSGYTRHHQSADDKIGNPSHSFPAYPICDSSGVGG